MPVKLVPKSQNDVTLALRALFIKTEQELINTIKRKKNLEQVDYAETAALMRVQQTLNQMVAKSNEYVPKMVERIFYETAKDFSGYTNATSLTVAQTGIVDVLVNNLLGEIDEMAQNATQSAREVLTIGRLEADKYRQAGLISAAEKEAAGANWRTAAERMNQRLQAEGITCFVDKAGRRWSMNAYGNMVARTTARQAQVAAVLTADDHDLYQIAKIGSTCPICAVYEGRVYSKSGNNPEYPPLAMAFGKIDPAGSNDLSNTYLNIHPNCLHTLMKYTTIGLTDKQIQRDKDFSSFEKNPVTHDPRTRKQIAAYKEKERNRQKLRRELKKKENKILNSKGFKTEANETIINLPDAVIPKSLGAKARTYYALNPLTGEWLPIAEGTHIKNVEVFAGKGKKKQLNDFVKQGLADKYGGHPEDWQHCKGNGFIDFYGEIRPAEIHWFQAEGYGRHRHKIKYWEDEG